jgi:hypothetical protein
VVAATASGWALLIAAVTAGLALLALLPVPSTAVRRDLSVHEGVHPVRSALHDIREGFVYMLRTPWLLSTLVFASLMILLIMGPFEVLVPFLIKDGLGGNAGDHALVLGAFGIGGALFSGPMVIWGTLLQRRVPPDMLGRASSLDFFVSLLLVPVSMAVAGPVAELIGLRNTFLVAGLVPMGIAAVAIMWARLPADELAHPL